MGEECRRRQSGAGIGDRRLRASRRMVEAWDEAKKLRVGRGAAKMHNYLGDHV